MRTNRFLVNAALLVSLSTVAFAQSEAQKSFEKLKTLAGSWEGRLTTVPHADGVDGKSMQISLRTTSMGNAMLHEVKIEGRQDDPITMLYLDADRLMLTHYCDAGNRPRMVGKVSPDGKKIEFDFLDVAGGMEHGHMHHAAFTLIDANHHTEEWTWMDGDKPILARFELQRAK